MKLFYVEWNVKRPKRTNYYEGNVIAESEKCVHEAIGYYLSTDEILAVTQIAEWNLDERAVVSEQEV